MKRQPYGRGHRRRAAPEAPPEVARLARKETEIEEPEPLGQATPYASAVAFLLRARGVACEVRQWSGEASQLHGKRGAPTEILLGTDDLELEPTELVERLANLIEGIQEQLARYEQRTAAPPTHSDKAEREARRAKREMDKALRALQQARRDAERG